ncbi:hypothetical protein D3C81_1423720 [compost metagenome]
MPVGQHLPAVEPVYPAEQHTIAAESAGYQYEYPGQRHAAFAPDDGLELIEREESGQPGAPGEQQQHGQVVPEPALDGAVHDI